MGTISKRLGVTLSLDSTTSRTWPSMHYQRCSDTVTLLHYLQLLQYEYDKYPAGYFTRMGVNTIVLAQDLSIYSQQRAAVPDVFFHTLYLEVSNRYDDTYLIHVMHHELHHCTEQAIWGNMYHPWPKWLKQVPRHFTYGSGGGSAYTDSTVTDWYSMTHPLPGFINLYATTGQEEDRCEIMALLMTDQERSYLYQYATDLRVKRKVSLMLRFLRKAVGKKETFWENVMMGWRTV
jgi:hypothetical protein